MRAVAIRSVVLLMVAVATLLSACSAGPDATDATTTSGTETTVPPSVTITPSTTSSVTTVPVTTTTVPDDDQVPAIVPGPPWPEFRPYDDIPWNEIATGTWVLYQFEMTEDPQASSGPWSNALFLLGPDGTSYAVRALGVGPESQALADWLPSRQLAILTTGKPSGGSLIEVVDLRVGTVVDTAEIATAHHPPRFVDPDGTYAVLREGGEMEIHSASGDTSEYSIGSTSYTDSDTRTGFVPFPDEGLLVTSSADTIAVRTLDGTIVHTFQPPGVGCYLTGSVDGAATVSCSGADYMEQCAEIWGTDGHRGVWMLPLDGGDAEMIYVPAVGTDLDPEYDCWIGAYASAVAIPDEPGDFVLELSGCCECGGGLALLRDGIASDVPGTPSWCRPHVITRWGDGWLILDSATDDATYRPSLIAVDEDLRNARVLVGIESGFGGAMSAIPNR